MKRIGLIFCALLVISVNNAFAEPKKSVTDYVTSIENNVGKIKRKGVSANRKVVLVKQILKSRAVLVKHAKKDAAVKNMLRSVDVQIAKDAAKALGNVIVSDKLSATYKIPVMSLLRIVKKDLKRSRINAKAVIRELQRILINSEDYVVQESCARTLGIFSKYSKEVSVALVAGLEKQLRVKNPKFQNVRVTNIIINSLIETRHKSAFIALMKVLQGAYPPPTKIAAQRALDNIQWD